MPNIITHGLFAKSVYDEINQPSLKNIIKEFPREFVIGSNGPDFFFFYKFFQKKHEPFRLLGNKVHSNHIHDFFKLAFECIENQEDPMIQKAMISYVCGHLCHWALDSNAHPYIFYKTGNYSGQSSSMHHRFESMLDAMMLKRVKNETIKTFKFYLLAKQSEYSQKAISEIYIPIIKEIFYKDITEKQIKDALDDWYHIQTWLYDPTGVKTKLLKSYDSKVKQPYLFSGYVIPHLIDETFDILNTQHKTWMYPTNSKKTSNEDFMEIMKRAKDLVVDILNHFDDSDYMLSIIQDISYDSGENERNEMVNFDLIYEDML